MTEHQAPTLVKLSDTHRTVADPANDVRGRRVKDADGNDIGTIDDLLVDETEHKVRFLRVEHGGILGFGATPSFVPVEAIDRITDDEVHLTAARHRIAESPRYEQDLADKGDYYAGLYGYYGYPPFWSSAAMNPALVDPAFRSRNLNRPPR